MLGALLAAALVLHHIEGVCKPRSPLTVLLDQFAAQLAQRDPADAAERARERAEMRRQAVVERALARELARAERTTAELAARARRALEAPQIRPIWQDSDATREAERVRRREG